MSNGRISHLKHLGLHWCFVVLAFAPLISLSDVDNDVSIIKTVLYDIRGDVSHLDEFEVHWSRVNLEEINANVALIETDVDFIRTYSSDILDELGWLTLPVDDDYHYFNVQDKPVLGVLTNLYNDLKTSQTREEVYQSTVTNQLADLTVSISNLVEAVFFYTNQFPVAAFPTNLVPILSPITADYYYSNETSDLSGLLEYLYLSIFGHYPTQDELDTWYVLYLSNGLRNLPLLSYFTQLSTSTLREYNSDLLSRLFLTEFYGYDQEPFLTYGDAYYWEYGTRPILQYLEQATNDYYLSSAVLQDNQGESSFSSGFVDHVGSLSSSYYDNAATNVSSISTNSIREVQNNGFSTQLGLITEGSINDALDQDLASAVSGFESEFVSFLVPQASADSVILDFGSLSFFGVSKNVSFTLNRFSTRYYSVLYFLYGLLKFLVLLFVAVGLYDFITQQSEL